MITVSWRDMRQMCGIQFIRLEDFLDSQSQGLPIYLEPQGILFAEVASIHVEVTLDIDFVFLGSVFRFLEWHKQRTLDVIVIGCAC